MNEFLQRLKERKLVQWTVAYCASAFALVQLRCALSSSRSASAFSLRSCSWYHGERGAQRVTGTELLILTLLLAIGGGFLWRFASVAGGPTSPAPALT
jgi:hypothetical protein